MPNPSIQELQAIIQDHHNWSAIEQRVKGELNSQVNAIVEELHQVQANPAEGTTVRVVHYTSLETVVAILNAAAQTDVSDKRPAGYLRLYGSARSNDPQEGRYLADECQELNDFLQSAQAPFAYIASFIMPDEANAIAKTRDNIPFWRAYGNGGQGCSLTLTLPADQLRAVRYGREKARETCQKLKNVIKATDAVITALEDTGNIYAVRDMQKWRVKELPRQMQEIQYLYKSNAYSYEKECRIVVLPNEAGAKLSDVKFEHINHSRMGTISARYIELSDLRVCATDGILSSGDVITIGPACMNKESVKRDLEDMLHKAGIQHTTVKLSEVSYRGS